jgi:uncharacterized protein YybS (DUF2232 family)
MSNLVPTDYLIIVGSVFGGVAFSLLSVLILYFIVTTFFRDPNVKTTVIDVLISQQLMDFFILLGLTVLSIANFLITTITTSLYFFTNNFALFASVLLVASGSAVFLQYHNVAASSWLIFRYHQFFF